MLKVLKKLLLALLLFVLILAAFIAYHVQVHTHVTIEEVVPAGEQADIEIAAKQAQNIVTGLQTSYAARGVHAKGHACVKAYVNVKPDIQPAMQHGVFAQPGKQYKAWIRFSNSGSNMAKADDRSRDARGMAIKLLNAGKNLNGGTTQEFIAHNSPAFFVNSVADYNAFVATKGSPQYFIQGYNPFKWRIRELWQLITAYSPPPPSPLWAEYFSNTAYKLGPHRVKFKMQACQSTIPAFKQAADNADFLRYRLAEELAQGEACMELAIQLQDASKQMPIEDDSVLWDEADAPFVPVAELRILQQTFDTKPQQEFCEDLSFSPWNALSEHQPVGALNRARRFVYQASSDLRHQINGRPVPTELDW